MYIADIKFKEKIDFFRNLFYLSDLKSLIKTKAKLDSFLYNKSFYSAEYFYFFRINGEYEALVDLINENFLERQDFECTIYKCLEYNGLINDDGNKINYMIREGDLGVEFDLKEIDSKKYNKDKILEKILSSLDEIKEKSKAEKVMIDEIYNTRIKFFIPRFSEVIESKYLSVKNLYFDTIHPYICVNKK